MNQKYIIGVDEAGRGSWAGPVSAGAFAVSVDFDFSFLPGLTDSKRLTSAKREKLFKEIEKLGKEGKCHFAYAESSADLVDKVGIREANRCAMEEALREIIGVIQISEHGLPRFARNDGTFRNMQNIRKILIDGRDNYIFDGIPRERVGFIVRGDLTEPVISAASIVAKVKRDRRMCDFSEEYQPYAFREHKGYGTRKHHDALIKYGITLIHRKSYAPVKALISLDS